MGSLSREDHADLLRREYQVQKLSYKSTLRTSAATLREKGALLLGKYVGFDKARGNVLFWFPATRAIPRRGEALFAFVPSAELTNPAKWGYTPYQELRGSSLHGAELLPRFWQAKPETQGYHIGFAGASADFIAPLRPEKIVCFGPQEPPLEYLANLTRLVRGEGRGQWPAVAALLDMTLGQSRWSPEDLPPDEQQALRVQTELAARGQAVIQGPPGTGKSHLTAQLCANFLAQGKRVIVTALTNRALLEILTKPGLTAARMAGRVYKAGLSEDEQRAAPGVHEGQDFMPQAGTLLLLTYYRLSRRALEVAGPLVETVVVEEASQAYLATIAAAQALGDQLLLVGDPQQLPPILETQIPDPDPQNLAAARDGLRTICNHWPQAAGFLLTDSFRLPPRAVSCTNAFYQGRLRSRVATPTALGLPSELQKLFAAGGGPMVYRLSLPLGERQPAVLLDSIAQIVRKLLSIEPTLEIAVLATYRATVAALQRAVWHAVGEQADVLVDTVARVQGLTTDVIIYALVNDGRANQVQAPHFNVATSRARKNTLIIAPTGFPNGWALPASVIDFLQTAEN